jgi:tetratricopeptide (TPR) repeat protein
MCGVGRTRMAAIFSALLLIAVTGASPLSAQRAETHGEQSPALVAGRDAIVNYGLTPEQVQELTKAAAAGAVGPLAKEIVDLSNRLGVTQGAALTLLRIVGQRDVPFERLPEKLAEVASQYQQAQAQLAALNPQNPLARGLVEKAQAEIMAGNFIKAHELLRQARQVQIAAAQQARALRQQAQAAEDEQLIQAAASSAAEGDLAMTELNYRQAAELFKEAADGVPVGSAHEDKRIGYLTREADALYRQGDEFGDNDALSATIGRRKQLIELTPRERVPLQWAMTQMSLGTVLRVLGARESGTQRLEEAVAAYRAALEEWTRERVPLDWASTMTELGYTRFYLGDFTGAALNLQEVVVNGTDDAYQRLSRPRSWAADMWAGKWLECRVREEAAPVAGVHPRRHCRMAGLATPPGGHHRPRHAREQPRRMVFSQQAATPGGRDPAESACPLKPRAPRVPRGSVGKRSTTFHMMVPKPARSNGTRPCRGAL